MLMKYMNERKEQHHFHWIVKEVVKYEKYDLSRWKVIM